MGGKVNGEIRGCPGDSSRRARDHHRRRSRRRGLRAVRAHPVERQRDDHGDGDGRACADEQDLSALPLTKKDGERPGGYAPWTPNGPRLPTAKRQRPQRVREQRAKGKTTLRGSNKTPPRSGSEGQRDTGTKCRERLCPSFPLSLCPWLKTPGRHFVRRFKSTATRNPMLLTR